MSGDAPDIIQESMFATEEKGSLCSPGNDRHGLTHTVWSADENRRV